MGFNAGQAALYAGTGGLAAPFGKGIFGNDDAKERAMRLLLEQMQRAQNLANVKAEGFGYQGLRSLTGGYDDAINNVARTAAASRTAAQAAGQQGAANIGQSMAGRGLYNTTALDAGRAMNAGATSQALANIDASVAQAKAGLQTAKGQAVNSANQSLGDLAERFGQQQQGPLSLAYQSVANAPTQMQQIMGLLQGVGSVAPMMMTGGAANPGQMAALLKMLQGMRGGGGGGQGLYDHDSEMG